MEKTDRELLIKEISSRLPYGIKAQVLGWDGEKGEVEVSLRVYSINTDGYIYFKSNDYDIDYVAVDNCLLYLRPMSSMTEEEECEFCRLFECDSVNAMYGYINWVVGGSCDCYDFDIEFSKLAKVIDWLNKHHFDYRGLIPMGLALEAPKNMYK